MISLTVTNSLGEVRQKMVVAANTLADWRPFFREWRGLWLASRQEMYATGGASTGTPWPMYSKYTKELQYAAVKGRMMGRKMTRADLLRWLGGNEILFPSLTQADDANNIYEESAGAASYGTRVPYARNHDQGSGNMPIWAGGHRVPRRNLMEFGLQLESDTAGLVGAFAAAGLSSIDEKGKARAGLSTEQVRALMGGR